MRVRLMIAAALLTSLAHAQFTTSSPFSPPDATIHYAPAREYDLQNISVDLTVDWDHRSIQGTATNTLAPLRSGLEQIALDAGNDLVVQSAMLDGRPIQFSHESRKLILRTGPLAKGRTVQTTVAYRCDTAGGRGFGAGEGGWHWISPRIGDPSHIGFWTQGESGYNSNWVPTWDYPNDFATSETRTTVPADWTVVGNGVLVSNTVNPGGRTRTFVWRMSIPHATYLLSLCGGPFEVAHDTWRDVPLWYVVPKGEGSLIPESFGHTKDMLSFYSDALGFKYPWPKYAQDAMYDFGGGMENVSATTLGEPSLTDARAGYFSMDSLNSHELGHQWFGDTVTCKDWGQVWLNESFATYMQIMYFEHSRGRNGYDREIENAMQGYFRESRRYKRPVVTNLYSNPDAMFDQHTYPKGGVILHTLRKELGDQAFFGGLHRYLTVRQHTPVETNDLCEAMTEASGINCHPFFDQWLYKPGHPVIDTTWDWDDAGKAVVLHVKQVQKTSEGTPIYKVGTSVGIIENDRIREVPITLIDAEQDFRMSANARPDAVLFDPEHNFLREISTLHWSASELPHLFRAAPNGVDRSRALRMMLDKSPSEGDLQMIVAVLKADNDLNPGIDSIAPLGALKREGLRPFFESQLNHPNFGRRAEAIRALGNLGPNRNVTEQLRGYVNSQAPYAVVLASMDVLSHWDMDANLDVFMRAASIPSMRNVVRTSALTTLARSHSDQALDLILKGASAGQPKDVRTTAILALGQVESDEPKSREAIRMAFRDNDAAVINAALQAELRRRDKALVPDVRALLDRRDLPDADLLRPAIQSAINDLES